jgi:hypothetical protein
MYKEYCCDGGPLDAQMKDMTDKVLQDENVDDVGERQPGKKRKACYHVRGNP